MVRCDGVGEPDVGSTRWLQPAPAAPSRPHGAGHSGFSRAIRPVVRRNASGVTCNRAAPAAGALHGAAFSTRPRLRPATQSAEGAHPADAGTGADPGYLRDLPHVHGLLAGSGSRMVPAIDWAAEFGRASSTLRRREAGRRRDR
jgi:hypothetical protein